MGSLEESPLNSEKDLVEDAPWKRIQLNTFTRWCNEHLKTVGGKIDNLAEGFSDGLMLIALVQALTGKAVGRHNKKPTMRSQKLENVTLALNVLEANGIRLVNIDSTHIVDQNLKLILGLVWTLIVHYSIAVPLFKEETGDTTTVATVTNPQKRLLNWIDSKISKVGVTNFTSSWSDGRALGALVNAIAPGLCPEWENWKSSEALENTNIAMDLAEKWLNVSKLIEPHELIDRNVDEHSVMTYVSQFSNAGVQDDAPIERHNETNTTPVISHTMLLIIAFLAILLLLTLIGLKGWLRFIVAVGICMSAKYFVEYSRV